MKRESKTSKECVKWTEGEKSDNVKVKECVGKKKSKGRESGKRECVKWTESVIKFKKERII